LESPVYYLDADEIIPNLWQGSAPERGKAVASQGFSVLVLCANDYQYRADQFPGVDHVIHAPFYDVQATPPGTWEIAEEAADRVVAYHQQGLKVLVTCMAGLNRSGLVTAWAIHKLKGWDGEAAIEVVKQKRKPAARQWDPHYPDPLSNESFCRKLRELGRAD
jgi:protein-tyrosine phosphatase